jgi:hypothetical protein
MRYVLLFVLASCAAPLKVHCNWEYYILESGYTYEEIRVCVCASKTISRFEAFEERCKGKQ